MSDSSSDEEMLFNIIQILPRERILLERRNPVELYNDEEFKIRYRFSKHSVREILQIIGPALEHNTQRGSPVSVMEQFLITLRFYATGSFQKLIGDHVNVSTATVCRIICRVSESIAALSRNYIKMPTNEELPLCKLDFYNICQFPGVIGCIDCTHIRIQNPGGQNAELFRNRKGYFSVNVQAVCDSKLRIRNIIARWPGSVHDSTIFNDSGLKMQLEAGQFGNGYLLGDSGYACKKYLLTPLVNPETAPEIAYNEAHIKTRNTVERLFGVWKRRFPCLSVGLRTKTEKSLIIIVATAVLHNIAMNFNDYVPDNEVVVPVEIEEPVNLHMANVQRNDSVRTAVINTYFNR